MNDQARNLALAVLIYHDDMERVGPDQVYDTFERWLAATGTGDCSAATLCKLARKVLEERP